MLAARAGTYDKGARRHEGIDRWIAELAIPRELQSHFAELLLLAPQRGLHLTDLEIQPRDPGLLLSLGRRAAHPGLHLVPERHVLTPFDDVRSMSGGPV